MTSHALSDLAGSRRTLLHAAGGHHGYDASYQKYLTASIDEQSPQISPRSDLNRRRFRLFEDCRPNNKNNKMSNDMGSVPDPKSEFANIDVYSKYSNC